MFMVVNSLVTVIFIITLIDGIKMELMSFLLAEEVFILRLLLPLKKTIDI